MQGLQLFTAFICVLLCALLLGLMVYLRRLKKQLRYAEAGFQNLVEAGEQLNKELTEYKNKFIQEVLRDSVTGLPRMPLFKDEVMHVLERCTKSKTICGLLFLDLKNFQLINNTLGYTVGDTILADVAKRLQSSIRQMDMLCRFSGDIFIVLMAKLSHPEAATQVVQRIFESLKEPYQVDSKQLSIPASIGIAIYPRDGADVDTLIKSAANALSFAKKAGAQQFQFYHAELRDLSERELLLNAELSREEIFGELLIEYQPQIDIKDNSIICWEALLRWQHPELGLIPAGEFINLAESNGKIEGIGAWVLQQVCRRLQTWRESGYQLPTMAVNISIRQIESPHFVSTVLRVLQETQVNPKLLIFEITEHDFLKLTKADEKTFSFLNQMGIRISVDQFGGGDSLLRQVKNFPVDVLKIDDNFVREIATSKESEAIVVMMLALAKSLNKQVIALGVETEAQKQILQQLGCSLMQGHLFSLPLNENEVVKKFHFAKAKTVQEEDLTVS